MAIYLPPFEPEREFVAQASFRADGAIWQKGAAFDKTRVNLRVLRQLYEARKINYAGAAKKRHDPGPARAPEPSEAEQVAALEQRYTKAQLLELAHDLESVKPGLAKSAVALALVRAGRGLS